MYPTACKQSLWRVNVLYAALGWPLYRRRPPSAQQQQQQREPISTNQKINGQTTGKLHPQAPARQLLLHNIKLMHIIIHMCK